MHIYTGKELRDWQSEIDCREAVENLRKHMFDAVYCDNVGEAKSLALELAGGAANAGFGGSKTIEDLGIPEALANRGVELLVHGGLPPEEKARVMARQKTCDVFFLSANALTVSGEIVNIDGTGNRISASIHGPKKVVFVIGRNKIVRGTINDAIARVHAKACAANAFRLGRKTPCAESGVCADCNSPERICRVIAILERRPSATETHVIVVNDDLGI